MFNTTETRRLCIINSILVCVCKYKSFYKLGYKGIYFPKRKSSKGIKCLKQIHLKKKQYKRGGINLQAQFY